MHNLDKQLDLAVHGNVRPIWSRALLRWSDVTSIISIAHFPLHRLIYFIYLFFPVPPVPPAVYLRKESHIRASMAVGILCFAYYCSGHGKVFPWASCYRHDWNISGYGHATRVSAFSRYLLSFPVGERPLVYIVSSAPERIFADAIQYGARYRLAEIDPVIVQPLA